MNNVKITKLTDGGIEKVFSLKKMPAMKLFLFTNQLLGLLAKSETINPEVIQQYMYNTMDTGIKVEGVDKEKLESTAVGGLMPLIFDLIKSLLSNLDNQVQVELLNPLINCITYLNGKVPGQEVGITLNLIEYDTSNIDFYIDDVGTIYKLLWELLQLNYASFFGETAKTNL